MFIEGNMDFLKNIEKHCLKISLHIWTICFPSPDLSVFEKDTMDIFMPEGMREITILSKDYQHQSSGEGFYTQHLSAVLHNYLGKYYYQPTLQMRRQRLLQRRNWIGAAEFMEIRGIARVLKWGPWLDLEPTLSLINNVVQELHRRKTNVLTEEFLNP